MANIATLLKQEILRLSRRETKGQTVAIKKATAQFRHDIAALKRKVALLERQVAQTNKHVVARSGTASVAEPAKRARFVPKGLKSLRKRLGLSAGDLGTILAISAQSVYNWEHGAAKPRAAQLAKIAGLRALTKKDVQAQLASKRAPVAKKARPTRKGR